MTLRRMYQLKALLTPPCWIRSHEINKAFDEWLWRALDDCAVEVNDEYTCTIKGRTIWIENAPYANGYLYENGYPELSCSRATALRLADRIAEIKAQAIKVMLDAAVASLQAEVAAPCLSYDDLVDEVERLKQESEARRLRADANAAMFRAADADLKKIAPVVDLIVQKFGSGNEIPVERITITRRELEQFLGAMPV